MASRGLGEPDRCRTNVRNDARRCDPGHRSAATDLNVVSDYTYTLETIIQAGRKRIALGHVPIGTNPKRRPSRLMASTWDYIKRSASTIVFSVARSAGLAGSLMSIRRSPDE